MVTTLELRTGGRPRALSAEPSYSGNGPRSDASRADSSHAVSWMKPATFSVSSSARGEVVGDAHANERVRPAHHAQPDAPRGEVHLAQLRHRELVDLYHIVEEAHRRPHGVVEAVPVEVFTPGRDMLIKVYRSQAAVAVVFEELLSTVGDD